VRGARAALFGLAALALAPAAAAAQCSVGTTSGDVICVFESPRWAGELASLGGFANEEVLQSKFKPVVPDSNFPMGVTLCRTDTGMLFFKLLLDGEEYDTDMFNVRLLFDKYFAQVHETSSKNVKEALRLLSEKWKEHNGKK